MKKGMKKWCFLGLLGTVMTVQAEEMDSLKNVELQDVQVVATRATKKTPMAFTNMNKEQLKAVNYGQDVPYLLSLTPSVTMTSDAGNGIGYTSLRVRGTDPSRINITANGVPMNDAESAQLYWVNMGDFASSVQSMQIQRGVGTSTSVLVLTIAIRRPCVSAQDCWVDTGASRGVSPISGRRVTSTVPRPS